MDIQEYISSGILELYVYGALSEKESEEVTAFLKQYPEVKAEVEEIEKSLINLSAATAPYNPEEMLVSLKNKLALKQERKSSSEDKIIPIKERTNWPAYVGWAACVVFLIGSFFLYQKNTELRDRLAQMQVQNAQMETEIANARANADKTQELLDMMRNKNMIKVPLQGQKAAPDAYAAVYWDKEHNVAFVDAKELPEPPKGMVYQVWSLKMNPLKPTSIGLLKKFDTDKNKIFQLPNPNTSEAFGITLEPDGGSKSPSMERLYTLGAINS
ncbi:MAG: anti-sigma factor [Gillisia sp.]